VFDKIFSKGSEYEIQEDRGESGSHFVKISSGQYAYLKIYIPVYIFNFISTLISGIQDVRLKYKQNWINHLEIMENTRLPKHALNYKPRGRRDCGRPRKRWQCVDAETGQTT